MIERAAAGTWVAAMLAALSVSCGDDTSTSPTAAAGEATWSAVPDSPLSPRYGPISVWDGDRFFVIGGYSGSPCPPNADCATVDPQLSDGASFDPHTGDWVEIAQAPVPLAGQSVVVGDTIYVSTWDEGPTHPASFLAYDITGDRWRELPSPDLRYPWIAQLDDTIMAVGDSRDQADNLFFDHETRQWRPLPHSPFAPGQAPYPVWTGEQLLLTAHKDVPDDEAPVVQIAALDRSMQSWSLRDDSEIVGWGPVSVADLVVWPSTYSMDGGEVDNWGQSYPEGAIYDARTDTWTDLPDAPEQRGGLWSEVHSERFVSMTGNLLDPVALEWTHVPAAPGGERNSAALVAGGNYVFMWGGAPYGQESAGSLATGALLTIEP